MVALKVIVESYIGEITGVLMVSIGSSYTPQEMLMKEHAVGVAGI